MTNVAGASYSNYNLVPTDPFKAYIKPTGLALDNSGNVYMTTGYVIKKWNVTTNIISLVAGSGKFTATSEGDGKRSTMAYLSSPTDRKSVV